MSGYEVIEGRINEEEVVSSLIYKYLKRFKNLNKYKVKIIEGEE